MIRVKRLFAMVLVMALALAMLSGCSRGLTLTGVTASAADQGVEVSLSVDAVSFTPAAVPDVTVEVRNTGKAPVRYIKSDGCDNGIRVTMDGGTFALKTAGPPRACTDAIEFADLAPGESLKAVYSYKPAPDQKPLAAGQHQIRAEFNRGTAIDQARPVLAGVRVTVR